MLPDLKPRITTLEGPNVLELIEGEVKVNIPCVCVYVCVCVCVCVRLFGWWVQLCLIVLCLLPTGAAA